MARRTWVYVDVPGEGVVAFEKGTEPSPEPSQALHNPLAGDRHYDGMRATDGTDISTRTKHREYMRQHGLTTADDFKDTWAKQQRAREQYRERGGTVTREDIARAIHRLGG
mgnify:CR=1 FL=1